MSKTRSSGATNRKNRRCRVLSCALALAVNGCSVPLLADLDEIRATRVLVTLSGSSIASSKEPDPSHEDRYVVRVARNDVPAALSALSSAGIPSREAPGILDALGEAGLVPTQRSEHARWVVGMSGELEESLKAIGGVISARVHLAVPADKTLSSQPKVAASASVLLRYRGATPPVAQAEVQRLVAGAITGLEVDAVSVITHQVPAAPKRATPGLVRVGPFSVTSSSVSSLRATLAGAAILNLLLVASIALLWARLRSRQASSGAAPTGGND